MFSELQSGLGNLLKMKMPLLHHIPLGPFIEMFMSTSGEDGEVTTAHLLLGIWSEVESAGRKILESLGFDEEKAKELGKSVRFKL